MSNFFAICFFLMKTGNERFRLQMCVALSAVTSAPHWGLLQMHVTSTAVGVLSSKSRVCMPLGYASLFGLLNLVLIFTYNAYWLALFSYQFLKNWSFGRTLNYLLVQTDRKFEFGSVLIVWDMWYNAESWSLMPRATFCRCLLGLRKKVNCVKDTSQYRSLHICHFPKIGFFS